MNTLPSAKPSANLRPLAEWYLAKGHRRLWSIPLTLGLVALIGLFILRNSMDDPMDNYAKSRAAVAALAPPPVPPEENAWEIYKTVFPLMVPYSGNPDNNPLWKTDDDVKYFEEGHVLALWKANAKAIELLQVAAEKERCNMELDLVIKPFGLTSYFNLRDLASLLALDARCQAHAGNHLAAAKSLRAIRSMARHCETQPLLIMEMLATALNSIADETFGAILAFDTPKTVEELQAYKLALAQKRDPFEQMARCVKYESAVCLYNLDGILIGVAPQTNAALVLNPGMKLNTDLAPVWYGADRRCYVAVTNATAEALLKRQQPEDVNAAIQRYQAGPAIITRLVAISYTRPLLAFFDTEERSRLAVTAAAFLQHRVKYGRDATSLEQLVPEFLPSVPKGVFHDEPFLVTARSQRLHGDSTTMECIIYKDRRSVRIYSVGRNGIDDFGNSENGVLSDNGQPDDLIFHVPLAKKADR